MDKRFQLQLFKDKTDFISTYTSHQKQAAKIWENFYVWIKQYNDYRQISSVIHSVYSGHKT